MHMALFFLKWRISFLWLVVLFVLVLNTPMLFFFLYTTALCFVILLFWSIEEQACNAARWVD